MQDFNWEQKDVEKEKPIWRTVVNREKCLRTTDSLTRIKPEVRDSGGKEEAKGTDGQ